MWSCGINCGDSSSVQMALFGVDKIYLTDFALAAVFKDGWDPSDVRLQRA